MARVFSGVPAPGPTPLQDGPVLSMEDTVALLRAPRRRAARRPPGTTVTVRSYNIPRGNGLPAWRGSPEHMYVEFDDGRRQLIARGGPNTSAGAALSDEWIVTGGVTPARQNRDYGKGERVLQQSFLPDLTAEQAAEPARRRGTQLEHDRVRYGAHANSNSFAADVAEDATSLRPGDKSTWGYRQRLDTAPRVRAEPLDLSPALRGPPY